MPTEKCWETDRGRQAARQVNLETAAPHSSGADNDFVVEDEKNRSERMFLGYVWAHQQRAFARLPMMGRRLVTGGQMELGNAEIGRGEWANGDRGKSRLIGALDPCPKAIWAVARESVGQRVTELACGCRIRRNPCFSMIVSKDACAEARSSADVWSAGFSLASSCYVNVTKKSSR